MLEFFLIIKEDDAYRERFVVCFFGLGCFGFGFFSLIKQQYCGERWQNLFLPSEALSSAAGGAMLSLNQRLGLIAGDITLKGELQA